MATHMSYDTRTYYYDAEGALSKIIDWKNGKVKAERFYHGGDHKTLYKDNGEIDTIATQEWLSENTSFAMAIEDRQDTFKVNEIYKAKMFMKNRKKFYRNKNLVPTMKFIPYNGSHYELAEKGKVISVKEDTGYVEIPITNEFKMKDTLIQKSWKGLVTIHLPEKDSSFTVIMNYWVKY